MSQPMRIGLVGPLPPPFGGMANQTRQLAEYLRNEGLYVSLVQTNRPYRPFWVSRVPILRALFRLIPYLLALWKQSGKCQIVHVMANSGWSWHLFSAPAIWIAAFRKTPVIVNYHGGEAESFLGKSIRLVRLTIRRASTIIVPSGFLQSIFMRFGMDASIVPNVVDLVRFNSSMPRGDVRRRFLVARNLEYIYDNETAIRAFSTVYGHHPDASLTIAGSGPMAETLQSLADSLGLAEAVVFTGRLDRDAMAQAYKNADIAINPSLVDNMPGSVMEALASGIPVISTDVGGIPFIVANEQTALLVPPKSPVAMSEAMLRLMDDSALCKKLIDNGLIEAQKYTWHRVWPLLAETYRTAIHPGHLPDEGS